MSHDAVSGPDHAPPLVGRRIAITGVTGQVAESVAVGLAADNEVIGLARFRDAEARARLEAAGVACHPVDFTMPDLSAVPAEVDHVLHFAVTKSGRWNRDLMANGEAVGDLMSHFRSAQSFLHCSSTAVYRPNGAELMVEGDPYGDHHRHVMPTYSIAKIAGETMARFGARHWELPTTIARLNVPYGDDNGWPLFHLEMMLAGAPIDVHTDGGWYHPIHHDDVLALVPALLGAASIPVTEVNLAGNDLVSIEEWCRYLGERVGVEPIFARTDQAIPSAAIDTTRQHALIGRCSVGWQQGMDRLIATTHPELLQS